MTEIQDYILKEIKSLEKLSPIIQSVKQTRNCLQCYPNLDTLEQHINRLENAVNVFTTFLKEYEAEPHNHESQIIAGRLNDWNNELKLCASAKVRLEALEAKELKAAKRKGK